MEDGNAHLNRYCMVRSGACISINIHHVWDVILKVRRRGNRPQASDNHTEPITDRAASCSSQIKSKSPLSGTSRRHGGPGPPHYRDVFWNRPTLIQKMGIVYRTNHKPPSTWIIVCTSDRVVQAVLVWVETPERYEPVANHWAGNERNPSYSLVSSRRKG
ncbi:hypothetical protein BJX68DRAFT_214859 [Aspergillus pseudodeflectus]|uniref:Uncharacterized protein n=1 Tax=Aspergillus pseudodeflectus TaxID=176178 RepID=A0ABR4JDU7_9EURO